MNCHAPSEVKKSFVDGSLTVRGLHSVGLCVVHFSNRAPFRLANMTRSRLIESETACTTRSSYQHFRGII